MSIRPRDLNEFFDRLGARHVRRGIVNGEFSGAELTSAKAWLASQHARGAQFWAAFAVVVAIAVGIMTAAASLLAGK